MAGPAAPLLGWTAGSTAGLKAQHAGRACQAAHLLQLALQLLAPLRDAPPLQLQLALALAARAAQAACGTGMGMEGRLCACPRLMSGASQIKLAGKNVRVLHRLALTRTATAAAALPR